MMLHARRKGIEGRRGDREEQEAEGRRGDREEQEALGRGSGSTSKRLPKFLIPLLALISLVSLQKFPSRRWRQQKRNNDSNGNEQQQNGRRNNGSSVFIDVGANCGNSYWKLKDDPKSGVLDPDEDWEVYLWECNPQMNEFFLRELAASNPSIHLIEKAASTVDGSLTFYLTRGQEDIRDKSEFSEKGVCDPKSPYSPSGASTVYGTAKRAGKSITVESVNFLRWFDDLVLAAEATRSGRGSSATTTTKSASGGKDGGGNENDAMKANKVVLKIDAEGAEKDVLEAMVSEGASGAICRVDMLWMEYHYAIFKEGTEEYAIHRKFKEDFPVNFEKKCGRKLTIGAWH